MKTMRRMDRQMPEAASKDLLLRGEYGMLSMVDVEGQPYGVPLNYVYYQDAIYVHCSVEGKKLSAIAVNPRVCFTVVGETQVFPDQFATNYESVMVFGLASLVEEAEKNTALEAIVRKYSAEHWDAGLAYIEKFRAATRVIKIKVENMTGKRRAG